MSIIALLSGYCFITTGILIFLLNERIKYRNWYRTLLINPDSPFRIKRFFLEMEKTFQDFYSELADLKNERGCPLTDYRFQIKWLVWWKFFGAFKPCTAIREFNSSSFLRKLLISSNSVDPVRISQDFTLLQKARVLSLIFVEELIETIIDYNIEFNLFKKRTVIVFKQSKCI